MDIPKLNLDKVKAVFLDLDGTLYDLKKMQRIMRKKILIHLLNKPWKFKEILIVYYFRKDRKNSSGAFVPDLKTTQYRWLQRRFDMPLEELESIIQKWMFDLPSEHLGKLGFSSVHSFFYQLKQKGIPYGIHSDLPLGNKLEALKIQVDFQTDATDSDINALKPHPAGVMRFAKKLGIETEEVLVLGDKKELDGWMAKEAHAQFFHIQTSIANQQYEKLTDLFKAHPVNEK